MIIKTTHQLDLLSSITKLCPLVRPLSLYHNYILVHKFSKGVTCLVFVHIFNYDALSVIFGTHYFLSSMILFLHEVWFHGGVTSFLA